MPLKHKKKSIKDFIIGDFIRECQSCGNIQGDTPPHGEPTTAFRNRACKHCGSEDLDYGTHFTPLINEPLE